MVFSSPIFLFLFLPIVLAVYFVLPGIRLRNLWLVCGSVIFYAWGEPAFTILMVVSVFMNWGLGLWLDGMASLVSRKWVAGLAVILNIGLLVFYKYSNFFVQNLNLGLGALGLGVIEMSPIRLPIGISFFTFQALSYVLDIYMGGSRATRKPSDVALYIFFFPQLIAGPIVRWYDIAAEMVKRVVTVESFSEGVRRFVYGLAKKVLIANSVAVVVDKIFFLSPEALTPAAVWLGVICYTLQIYFDFSGYSDMAIGLGKMFGFNFMENFRYPYAASSVRDFWRGWHISLSTWFRDYLYIPLGGNRCLAFRNHLNLVTVFFLCGLWHGASWTFVVWGVYHGFFLVIERTWIGEVLSKIPRGFRHAYTLLVVAVGWTIFRSDTLQHAQTLLATMFNFSEAFQAERIQEAREAVMFVFGFRDRLPTGILGSVLTKQAVWAVILGVIFSVPIAGWFQARMQRRISGKLAIAYQHLVSWAEIPLLAGLFIVSAAWLADGTYNPFIYFRF